MIIKGASRAGPRQLARHLQRADTNERVSIVQLDSPTDTLVEAFRDWQLLAGGTRGNKGLYHANIDPDARYPMTAEQWKRAVDVLEKELGLEGQPRAVVMHEKHGRQHVHVVWQRTDIDGMKLIPDSFNYKAHERASLALEQEFGHEIVPGKHAKRDREKQQELPKAEISHAEWQQGERAGIDPRAFKDAITALYQRCDSGHSFQVALEEHRLLLAKGDRRDYVIVDENGQVYSLARQIKGVTAKDLREFMSDLDRDKVPIVEQAKAQQRARDPLEHQTPSPAEPPAPALDEQTKLEAALKARNDEELRRLKGRQVAEYAQNIRILDMEIGKKLQDFDAMQQAARDRFELEQAEKLAGIAAFIASLKALFAPAAAAEDARRSQEERDAFDRALALTRETQRAQWTGEKEQQLAELSDRHAQQQRELTARLAEDRARYAREHEAAEQLRVELEKRRRQREEELRAEQQRTRDGPPLGRAR